MGKHVILAALCALVFTTPAPAAEWSADDKTRQAAYYLLHVVDWGQTRYAARSERYTEANPILGPHPTIREVDTYFAATALLHLGVAHLLPPGPRRWFQAITIGMQAQAVAHNYSVGVRVDF